MAGKGVGGKAQLLALFAGIKRGGIQLDAGQPEPADGLGEVLGCVGGFGTGMRQRGHCLRLLDGADGLARRGAQVLAGAHFQQHAARRG